MAFIYLLLLLNFLSVWLYEVYLEKKMTLQERLINPRSYVNSHGSISVRSCGSKLYMHDIYTFSSSPRALYTNRKLTIGKEQQGHGTSYTNMMYDKRVFRGSNYAAASGHLGDGESAAAREAEARRRALARRKAKNQQIKAAELRIKSPPPLPGRKHEPIQTDLYLEEIWAHPPVENICTQTDLFLERPYSPIYIPPKTGIDIETQIYPGDLFDFDMEVQPILEVLVGKTIEQSLIEVLEEEELASLREQQRKFLEIRAAECAEVQRLEERERRLHDEKERRLLDHEEGLAKQKELEDRISAAVLMVGYMAELLPSVLEGLEGEGFLADEVKEDIDDSFMPWLMKEVTHELCEMVSTRDVLTDIVKEILENRAEIYRALNLTPRAGEESDREQTDDDDTLDLLQLDY